MCYKWFYKVFFLTKLYSFQIWFGLRFGFWVLTRLLDRSSQIFFFLNQNDFVLVKKKKSTCCNQVFNWVLPGRVAESHRVFPFPIFSSTWPGSGPGSARSWVNQAGRVGFQNYMKIYYIFLFFKISFWYYYVKMIRRH